MSGPARPAPWAALAEVCGDALRPGGLDLTRRALDFCRFPVPSRLVDMACGPGATLRLLASLGHEAVGVDADPALAAPASAGGPDGRKVPAAPTVPTCPIAPTTPTVLTAPMEAAPLPDGWADGLFCECALNLAPDREAALAEFWRILRPGGLLVASDLVVLEAAGDPGGDRDGQTNDRPSGQSNDRPSGRIRPGPVQASGDPAVPPAAPSPAGGPRLRDPRPAEPRPAADPCLAGAATLEANLQSLERAGFTVRLAEDHRAALKSLAAALVWRRGREGLAALSGLGAPCGGSGRLGYHLFIAEKGPAAGTGRAPTPPTVA